MHLTISVTVIMFELTGALTYILPTMVRNVIPQVGLC
jgi:chloride channel 3/4/5